jgi:AhpD family alkylhydroperoxidase
MARIDYYKEKPALIEKLRAITKEQEEFLLNAVLRALIELRVSQINGCVFCVDLHFREARALGEEEQRLDTLSVWCKSPFFDDREKAALAWAESLTLISETQARDAEYCELQKHFSEREIVELSLSISLANFWNRMAGGFHKLPIKRKM